MCDKLVFDLAQEVEGSPSVFVRKDWINILDNQTQNYTSNQSIIDTSQLSNSNKYMSYRESYFLIPLTVTLASGDYLASNVDVTNAANFGGSQANFQWKPNSTDYSDSAIGLKNWFGNIIHSFTLDYNGSTIIQQTPFVNMWNSFKLMTSLSYNDVITQGCTIGFYPDNPQTFEFYLPYKAQSAGGSINLVTPIAGGGGSYAVFNGTGVCNNTNQKSLQHNLNTGYQQYDSGNGNDGLINRQKWISYDEDGIIGKNSDLSPSTTAQKYSSLLSKTNCSNLWKSYISYKQDQVVGADYKQTICGQLVYSVIATVYLKHVHSFFNMCPLLKGVFMKMTMNLNNASSTVYIGSNTLIPTTTNIAQIGTVFSVPSSAVSALGGVNMVQLSAISSNSSGNVRNLLTGTLGSLIVNFEGNEEANARIELPAVYPANTSLPVVSDALPAGVEVQGYGLTSINQLTLANGATNLLKLPTGNNLRANAVGVGSGTGAWIAKQYLMNISVGSVCLDQTINSLIGVKKDSFNPCKSIYLYIPAYTFNPPFEQAYISSPVKSIKYTDIYQYQVLNIAKGGQFNNLLTNGIANIKSVLLLPFFNSNSDSNSNVNFNGCPQFTSSTNGFLANVPVWMSPYDPAGCGPTSPLCHFTNFNVQVSGQNAIYNLQLRSFEQFNNQLYGQNAVNGGLTDGITSSLIDRLGFDMEYCYYYVNVERMLPVEQSVPKSIQILGTSYSELPIDLLCFIEYGTEVNIDVLTGARV
jgi:hypothetical protein